MVPSTSAPGSSTPLRPSRGPGRLLRTGVVAATAAVGGILALVALVASVAATGAAGVLGPAGGAGFSSTAGAGILGPAGATHAVPAPMLALYRRAAAACPGLPWEVLAAIGTVESDDGRSTAPGVRSGANAAGAEGPMQFEPATFAAYDRPVPPGGARPPSPYDPTDAVFAAARLLCADGARDGADIPGAVFAYDHSTAYVRLVLDVAVSLGAPPSPHAGAAPLGPPGRARP